MNKEKLYIKTKDERIIKFLAEIPKTNEEYQNGWAYRKSMPKNSAILYDFSDYYPNYCASMFTPQTEFSVDFIFADNVGNIVKIHHNAEPLSEKRIKSYCTNYVLEVNGGTCKEKGINVGDCIILKNQDLEEIYTPIEINNKKSFKIFNEYFCESDSSLYVYTYKTHRWNLVERYAKEDFECRFEHFNSFIQKEYIDINLANNLAIKKDKELQQDFEDTKRRYFWYDKNLFIEMNCENFNLKYYDFIKKCFIKIDWKRTGAKFDDIKWNSLLITKKELISLIKQKHKENSVENLNKSNIERILKLDNIFSRVPYTQILYKTDNSDGWYIGYVNGSGRFAKEICDQYIKLKKWLKYKVRAVDSCDEMMPIPFKRELNPTYALDYPSYFEELKYNVENKKYYIKNETVPYPTSKAMKVSYFKITTGMLKENSYLIYFDLDNEKIKFEISLMESIGFANSIKHKLVNKAFAFYKATLCNKDILAWQKDDYIRITIQYYNGKTFKHKDYLIKKAMFIEQLNKLNKEHKEFVLLKQIEERDDF